MEWTKVLSPAREQGAYLSNEISLLFETGSSCTFVYNGGHNRLYSIVNFDKNGNIKKTMDYDMLPDFLAQTKDSALILGSDSSGSRIYSIINNNNVFSREYGRLTIPLSAFSVELNNKNMFIIFYGDADRGTVENPAIVYKIIDEGGSVISDGTIPSDLLGIIYPYVVDDNICFLTMDRDRNAHIIKLSSNYAYDGNIKLNKQFEDNVFFKKDIFLSDKIFMLLEYEDRRCSGYVFDIKTSQFSKVNFYTNHNRVNEVVLYSKDSIALVCSKYIIIYNLSENKEYVAHLDFLNLSISHILPLQDNEIIIVGDSDEPSLESHPILKRVTIHPVPR